MSLIHDIIKIKYINLGYLPNYPYHMISDREMFDAFIDLSSNEDSSDSSNLENVSTSTPHFFEDYYSNPFGPEDFYTPASNLDPVSLSEAYYKLRDYIESCSGESSPFKIIVTYDSLYHVLDVLNEYYSSNAYVIVIDEFQSNNYIELSMVSDYCIQEDHHFTDDFIFFIIGAVNKVSFVPVGKPILPYPTSSSTELNNCFLIKRELCTVNCNFLTFKNSN